MWLTIQIDGIFNAASLHFVINTNKRNNIDNRNLFRTIVRIELQYLSKIFL